MKVYKITPSATIPTFGSKGADCFDVYADLRNRDSVKVDNGNASTSFDDSVVLNPGRRMLVPTGLIFDLDEDTALHLHSRSGHGWKHGVCLANSTGIIDNDYTDELFVLLINLGHEPFKISHGDRVAQGRWVTSTNRFEFTEVYERPGQKTDRAGGLGSTGS